MLGHQLLFHLSWPFLDSAARAAILLADPIMVDYARLQHDAFFHRWSTIREALLTPRPPPELVPHLCHFRSWFMGAGRCWLSTLTTVIWYAGRSGERELRSVMRVDRSVMGVDHRDRTMRESRDRDWQDKLTFY